ncbi:uncharacterized protein YutE (UPF0331/DUF86 family) [Aureibacillus halotolerans]|uniref:Uncharacterized protein YutE (UPF0331/DUF86 family) n=1 Tax=Aureibacillus halotolerans TaxID=1508390 RepID=A0A4R6TU46_9BACI|nr:uncharacterized protein YutE (UPF0331/DUF86 family) [Aureibacillus halotolerans]
MERCVQRVKDAYQNDLQTLEDFTKQDSIVLNLQRASEAAIDLAMHIVSEEHMGLPQNSRDAFALLESHEALPSEVSKKLQAMVGFRNIAVHDDQEINVVIVRSIIENHLNDFQLFAQSILAFRQSE